MNFEITKDYKWSAILRERGQHTLFLNIASQLTCGAINNNNMDLNGSFKCIVIACYSNELLLHREE